MEKRITVQVSPQFHKQVKIKTLRENTSIKDVTVKLLSKYLKEKSHGDDSASTISSR